MATLAQLIDNVAKIRRFVGIYLDLPELNEKQKAALRTDLVQLDKNLGALQAAMTAPVAIVPAAPPPPVRTLAEDVPDFGPNKAMSSALYGDWVSEWFKSTFPEAYKDWPPVVHAVTPQAIVDAAIEDGCLAQVCAAGSLGFPGGPYDDIGDWSLFTALVSTTAADGLFVHRVFHMGALVGEEIGGFNDGLDFAKSLGFDW